MKKKTVKMPYQEYQSLQQKRGKSRFTFKPYPLPVLAAILVPLAVFLCGMIFYFINIKNFAD
jgi:hypothetical protein